MAKILVVDDASFLRLALRKILEPEGHTVVEASSGKDAVQKYQIENPDIVTMDITMEEMDGIEAVREIKKLDSAAKIIMCSAMGQQMKVYEAITAGAQDFIVKPFKNDVVIAAINKALR